MRAPLLCGVALLAVWVLGRREVRQERAFPTHFFKSRNLSHPCLQELWVCPHESESASLPPPTLAQETNVAPCCQLTPIM